MSGEEFKRLGAATVVANTDTSLYTVPASTMTTVSSVCVCNRGGTDRTYRLAHVDGAIGAVANEDYITYDVTIAANTSQILQVGITMAAADSLLARADHADVNFIAWGAEVS